MKAARAFAVGVVVAAAGVVPATESMAAFPGDDGLIAFSYESPVNGEHLTQNDIYTMEPAARTCNSSPTPRTVRSSRPAWNAR